MKSTHSVAPLVLGALLLCIAPCTADATNPIQKVLELLATMEQEIIKAGEESHKGYSDFADMCQERSWDLSNEIKGAKALVADLEGTIGKATDDQGELTTEIEELGAVSSSCEADLKAATAIRQKETGDFAADQKDLIETIGQMERAISIVEKQQKEGASLAQLPKSVQKDTLAVQRQRAAALSVAFSAMIDSSSVNSADSERLASLIQSSEGDADSEASAATDGDAAELDAAEESYSSNAGGPENSASIVETLENMLEKAQGQLDDARSKETKSKHNYELFKASLERKIEQAQKDMNDAKKAMGEAGQTRAQGEGEVEITKKDLGEDVKSLNQLHHECMTKATDFEAETKSRGEELQALATAKKLIREMTGGAEEKTYGKEELISTAESFLQAKSRTASVPPAVKAVRVIRALGKQQNIPVLIEMAHKMESVVRNSEVSGADPFAKVKGMLSVMLNSLQRQMETEANHKVYCDKEMSDTSKSKHSKESVVDKLQTRIDGQNSDALNIKEQVSRLQKELLAIMKTQREMDHMRKQEHALYASTKPELESGQEGIKKALQVLRQYYSQDEEKDAALLQDGKREGAGGQIIGILEVVESDFAKAIANLEEQEETSKAQYIKQTDQNKLDKAVKQEDVGAKTKAVKVLGKVTSETSTDLDGVQTELDAVNEYFAKIQQECVAKADPYEERRKRHEMTLQGLQNAMQILQGRAGGALVQQNSRQLRGASQGSEEDA